MTVQAPPLSDEELAEYDRLEAEGEHAPFLEECEAGGRLRATITALTTSLERCREALRKNYVELSYCADQLKARGARGRPGGSVSTALAEAKAYLNPTPSSRLSGSTPTPLPTD